MNNKTKSFADVRHSQVMQLNSIVDYQSGAIVSKVIAEKKTGTVTLFSFAAGQALSEHSAPFDAIVNVIEGEAEVIIAKKSNQMQAGDVIIMPANVPHAVRAGTNFKMLLTMIKS